MNHAIRTISETLAILGAAISAAAAVEARRAPSASTLRRLGISESAFRKLRL